MYRYCTVWSSYVLCTVCRIGQERRRQKRKVKERASGVREEKRREEKRERLPVLESETQEKQQWSKGTAQQQAQQHTAVMPRVRTAVVHAVHAAIQQLGKPLQ